MVAMAAAADMEPVAMVASGTTVHTLCHCTVAMVMYTTHLAIRGKCTVAMCTVLVLVNKYDDIIVSIGKQNPRQYANIKYL